MHKQFNKIKQLLSLSLMGFICLLLMACQTAKSTQESALQIKAAINENDLIAFKSFITLPLFVSDQKWESASDGIGFMLGERSDKKILSDLQIRQLIEAIHILGSSTITEEITLPLFSQELSNLNPHWENLDLVLFKRGEGDVEHIVLLGLDKKTKKLRSMYIN